MSTIDVNALGAAAMNALRRGDAQTARKNFQAIVSSSAATPPACIGLALACQALGDEKGMNAALDTALALDPHDLRALLMKGDAMMARGDKRAAIAFYGVVKRVYAEPDALGLPPEAIREVKRAHGLHDRISDEIFAHMQQHLSATGYSEASASRRFNNSLALLSGRKERYEQEPRSYFMPELPGIAFYDREQTPWLNAMDDAFKDIRAELQQLLDDPKAFAPFIEPDPDRPAELVNPLIKSEEWTACHLWRDGAPIPEMVERCPRTMEALNQMPLELVKGRSPFSIFSRLKPGAWIRPHKGFLNTRLVCHLPLIVPPGCWFRVGAELREWEEGKSFAFNDTFDHEARNTGVKDRIILIFNVWRPELTLDERRHVAALMESINAL